jgi:hypothetical protein
MTIFGGCPIFEHKVLQASWPAWASPVADATFSRWIWVNSMDPATGSGYILYTQPSNVGEKTTSLTHPSWWNSECCCCLLLFVCWSKSSNSSSRVVLLQTNQVLGMFTDSFARCISTKPSIHEITVWGSSNVVKPQSSQNCGCVSMMVQPYEPWSILTIWLMVIPSIIRILIMVIINPYEPLDD